MRCCKPLALSFLFIIFAILANAQELEIHSFDHQPMGGHLHHLRLVLHNTGWLPTNITKKALERKAIRELEVDIALPEGARLVSGDLKTKLGQLSGRDGKGATSIWSSDATGERTKVEWVVEAPPDSEIVITAVHQRAGVVRQKVTV